MDIGVSLTPKKPAAPIPTTVEKATTKKITIVPAKNLSISHDIVSITKNIKGVRLPASCKPTSEKALLSIETPVREILTPLNSASIRSRSSLAASTASGTSSTLASGYCNTTLTAVTPPEGVTRLFTNNGSFKDISLRRSSSDGDKFLASMTRSATISSSPIALVY